MCEALKELMRAEINEEIEVSCKAMNIQPTR